MPVGFANARRMPLRKHELILVFYKRIPTYHPQGLIALEAPGRPIERHSDGGVYASGGTLCRPYVKTHKNYPASVLSFANPNGRNVHPTQKPQGLFEYLIRAYTNPGETVLDCCMGSGATPAAAIATGRRFIGIEKDADFLRRQSSAFGPPQKKLGHRGLLTRPLFLSRKGRIFRSETFGPYRKRAII